MVVLSGDKPMSTIQVAKVGSFKSKRYGKFNITEKHVDDMVANLGRIGSEPPVDYHHLSMLAANPDQTLAAGWFKSLEKREDKSLWGTVEWTPKAAQHIKDGELKYVSPVIVWETDSETGEGLGTSLMSAALTNYPFLKGMQAVSLSDLQAQGILLADLSIDQKRSRISEALQSYHKDSTSYCWLRDVFDDYVVYELGSKLYKLSYTMDSKFGVSFSGTPEEVVPQYVSLSAHGGTKMADDPKPNADVVKLQNDFATLQSQFTQMSTQHTALSEQLATERTENQKLRDQINTTAATTKVESLIRQGKLVPAQKETMVELALKDPIFFDKMSAGLQVVVKLNTTHGTNAGDEGAADFSTDGAEDAIKLFDDKVAEYKTAHPNVKTGDAILAVDKANPGLYEKRRLAYAQKTAVTQSNSVQ